MGLRDSVKRIISAIPFWIGAKHRMFDIADYGAIARDDRLMTHAAENTAAWNALVADAINAGAGNYKKGKIYFRPNVQGGRYAFDDSLVFPDYFQARMVNTECIFSWTGNRDRPAITIGPDSVTAVEANAVHKLGTVRWENDGFSPAHLWNTADGGQCDHDLFAGIRLRNSNDSRFVAEEVVGFAAGVQLRPNSAATQSVNVGYCDVLLQRAQVCRYGIDLRSDNIAWVNENKVALTSFARSSSGNKIGSVWAYRLSSQNGGPSPNNNVIGKTACETNGTASGVLLWGAAVNFNAGDYFVHNGYEYCATVAGTLAEPVHTAFGTTVANAKCIGYFRSSAIVIDDGAWLEANINRRETGYGPPISIRTTVNNKTGQSIRYKQQMQDQVEDAQARPTPNIEHVEQWTPALNSESVGAKVDLIDSSDLTTVDDISDFHLRMIRGTNHWVCQGFPMLLHSAAHGANLFAVSRAQANFALTRKGWYGANDFGYPAVIFPVDDRCYQFKIIARTDTGLHRLRVWPLDADKNLALSTSITGVELFSASNGAIYSGPFLTSNVSIAKPFEFKVNRTDVVKYVALSLGGQELRSFRVERIGVDCAPESIDQTYGRLHGPRMAESLPTMGIFPTQGEVIVDINGGGAGWKVTTQGALAPAYADATVVRKDELRSDGSDIYYADEAHTSSGATMAADAAGTWTLYSGIATLIAV